MLRHDRTAPERRPTRAERERRAGRLRRAAAFAVVAALAVGWFATARMGRTDALAEGVPAGFGGPTPTTRNRADASLLRLLPAGARCHDQDRSSTVTRCEVGGVAVDYEQVAGRRVRSAYAAALGAGAGARRRAAGQPACARGAEDERAWSRPEDPTDAAGRYACRVEQGRAAMWWTVDDRGLLAHATAADGDLASLFAWWESHSER